MTTLERRKVKYLAYQVVSKSAYADTNLPYVGLENISSWSGKITLNEMTQPEGQVAHFEPGDILFGKLRPYLAKVALPDFHGVSSTEALVLRCRPDIEPRYLRYVLVDKQFIDEVNASTYGAKMPRASWEFIGSRIVGVPDTSRQKRIADFLDRETARIDQLIEKKERQLPLLDEQHQAFVTHATTLGLNQGVARQRTIYAWVPEIPAHWTTARLKFVASRIVDCLHETPEYSEDGEYPCIRTSDVSRGFVDVSTARRISMDQYLRRVQRLEPQEGDVLFTREGERYGLAALVPPNTKLCLGQRMMMFRANDLIRPAYLMWSLNGEFAYQYLSQSNAGATSPHLNIFDIRNAPVFLPPLAEQDHIVDAINERFRTNQCIAKKVQATVELLRDYRSALITAAVTGQIDVETWRKRGNTDRQLDAIEEEMSV